MTSFISHTTIDAQDAYALSTWWKDLLGYTDMPDDPNSPGDEECMIQRADGGHQVLFIEVPDTKQGKNRLHLDLRPADRSRDDEVDRLLVAGATLVSDQRGIRGPGSGWAVLADPEGNEFCILRSPAELAAG